MAPDVYGPFRAVRQLGAGRLGPTFHAHQPETDCLVAVKAFSLGLADDRAHQLLTELNALTQATPDHFNIATPLSAGRSGASAYLAQELAPGDPLEVTLRNRLVAQPADVARLTTKIAGVLDVGASVGVVHGRLNPRDVIFTADGFRLTGLGVARALETVAVFVPPRAPYAAPERVAAFSWGPRADTFSLAAMMFELLWGRSIAGPGEQADGLEPLPGADLQLLREAFARALAPDAADRFETAGGFAAAIECACAEALALTPPNKRQKSPLTDVRPATTVVIPALIEAHAPRNSFTDELDASGDPTPLGMASLEAEGLLEAMAAAARDAFVTTASRALDEPEMAITAESGQWIEERQETQPDVVDAAGVVVAARAPRRYSVWWLFLGPAVGVAIGYALVGTFDRIGYHQPVRQDIRRDDRSITRRVSAETAFIDPEALQAIGRSTDIE